LSSRIWFDEGLMGELKSTRNITVPVNFPASASVPISTGHHLFP